MLLEAAAFIFLDGVQIKMLEFPRRLFVSIFFLAFLAASDEEKLDGESLSSRR